MNKFVGMRTGYCEFVQKTISARPYRNVSSVIRNGGHHNRHRHRCNSRFNSRRKQFSVCVTLAMLLCTGNTRCFTSTASLILLVLCEQE